MIFVLICKIICQSLPLCSHEDLAEKLCMQKSLGGRFRTARAQRGHSANYYGDYPGNNPENHPPAESCTINSKLKNSNI